MGNAHAFSTSPRPPGPPNVTTASFFSVDEQFPSKRALRADQLNCSAGFGVAKHTCVSCAPGSYSLGGSGPCVACEAGTYQPSPQAMGCFAAPPDFYIAETGATNCCAASCPKGTYSRGGASMCLPKSPQPVACAFPMISDHFSGLRVGQGLNHSFGLLTFPYGGDTGGGIGNFLVFWPAAFYYAAFLDRKIAITDNSLMGELCKSLKCGTQLLSAVKKRFPLYFEHHFPPSKRGWANNHKGQVKQIKMGALASHFTGESPVFDEIVSVEGFRSQSNWFLKINGSIDCVSKLSGCSFDVSAEYIHEAPRFVRCAEKYAFRQLIKGPLFTEYEKALHQTDGPANETKRVKPKSGSVRKQKKKSGFWSRFFGGSDDHRLLLQSQQHNVTSWRTGHSEKIHATDAIIGIPPSLSRAFYVSKHEAIRFVDVGVHLRLQFKGFELVKQLSGYSEEVKSFLDSTESRLVFQLLADRVTSLLGVKDRDKLKYERAGSDVAMDATKQLPDGTVSNEFVHPEMNSPPSRRARPYNIFVSADNEEAKIAFVSFLKSHLDQVFLVSGNHTVAKRDNRSLEIESNPPSSPSSNVKETAPFHVFYRRAGIISHCKHFEEMQVANANSMDNLVFDWYALSASRRIVAYRRPTHMCSTFVQSAMLLAPDSVVDYQGHRLFVTQKPSNDSALFVVNWARFE